MHFSFIVSMVLFLFFAILFCSTLIFKVAYKLILDDNTDDKTITVHSLVAGKLHFEKKKKPKEKMREAFVEKRKLALLSRISCQM